MFDYGTVVNFFDLGVSIALLIFFVLGFYYVLYFFDAFRKPKRFEKGSIYHKFCILIPARNEDKVIRHILESLKNQDYPKEFYDVFVIIESKDDPTFNITQEFGFNVFIRKDLVNKRTKGFALQEAINHIKTLGKKYDCYMIFDADNVVNSDYISLMNDVKNKGYQVGVGYRNFTNSKVNWISACSATLFSFMNQFTSKGRSRYFEKATLTGTGYYIDCDIVDNAGGWIWTGFTEDVALTTYCYYHNISMHYYPFAMYYDEQPTKFKEMHKQHIRWVFGFVEDKDKYKKNGPIYNKDHMVRRRIGIMEYNLSIWPFAIYIIMEFLAFIVVLFFFIFAFFFDSTEAALYIGWHTFLNFILFYGSFILMSLIAIGLDNKNLKFSKWQIVKICLTYVLFFGDFVLAFIDGGIHKSKRTEWKKIEHSGVITNEEIKNNEKANKNKK